ncbi:MAG: autotransporter-associated beta strand repeat-containing protein, partial [Kiritimatiellae bacterium]|nr:autotransporter-associated beta strand repeat-containing protein [Kiritimatiellia bacterium]
MKRSYSYLKGLLTLALAAFTGWMWAEVTTYPAMPSYSITSAEYADVTCPVLMPTPAVTEFTVTILYQTGGQRSDISQVILVDPATSTTVASDVHEGYSGGSKYLHVYTLSNIPESYAGKTLLAVLTVKCNEAGAASTCNVELSNGVIHTSYTSGLHEYTTDKEAISINFGDSTAVTGYYSGIYAAGDWNNVTGATGTKKVLSMWSSSATKDIAIDLSYASATTWGWADATDAYLDGYLDDGGNKAQVTLKGIPFSQYSVIVYCATDTEDCAFNPVTINGTEYIGSETYTEGTGYAAASSDTWGASHSQVAVYGTNALRLDGLTGDLSIVGGANANSSHGGIAAIQVINTGTLGEYTEAIETQNHTVMGYTYPLIFRGTTDANWETIANWYTLSTVTIGEDVTETWTAMGGEKVPGTANSNLWTATIVDGAKLVDTITVGSDGYKTITVPQLEGWESRFGAANGVHLSIEGFNKVQADSDWRVDETSKVTIKSYASGSNGGTHNVLCLAENGIDFQADCNVSFNYTLGKNGSVNYTGALSGTQTIKGLVLDLGDSTLTGVEVKTRKLIGFASSSATFSVANNATITTTESGITATAVASPVNVGEYALVTEAGGLYIKYVGYGEATYTTVTASADADTTLSALGLTGGEMTIAEITLADGVTLTIDEAATFAAIKVISTGNVTIASSTENLANIGTIDAAGVTGTATYATASALADVPGKLADIDVIKKTGDDTQTPTSLAILDGRQLIVANGQLNVDITFQNVTATADKPVLVTGANAKIQFIGTNHQMNRMPNDGYVKATDGGTIIIKGVNLFNGNNAPHIVLDGGVLQTTATAGGYIKVNSVSMANGSKIQLSRVANAYESEGLYIRTGDDSKLTVTAGDNTVEFLEDGTNNNALKIDGGVIEIASGASLDVKVPVVTDVGTITKSGEGTLVWNGSTTNPIAVSAGKLVFNANAKPTNAFSGAGTIVADGATLDLTAATVADTLALTTENNGVLILTLEQVGTMTVPAGGTLKVLAGTYNEVSLTGVTLADDTAKVIFVLPNNREVEATVTTEDGVTTITMPSQKAFVWTPAVDTNWSTVGNWVTGGEAMTAAPTAEELTQYPVIIELAADTTLTMDTAASLVDLTIYTIDETAATHVLTIAGENALTTKHISSDNKVIVSGNFVIDAAGTETEPTEITNVIEVANGGTLTTKGYVNLSANNQILAGTLTASTGVTTFKGATGSWDGGLQGTINVNAGAKLALAGSDVVNWNGGDTAPLTINVKGELALGTTRLGLNKKTLNLYAGATVTGEGDGQGALDYFGDGSVSEINVLADGENTADVTVAAKIRTREGALPTFTVDEGMTAVVSGVIFGGSKIVADGTGTLKLTGTNTYTGGTTINEGATIEIVNIDNLAASGDVVVNGRLRIAPNGNTNQSGTAAYGTAEAPRLTGTGVLEFAGDGHYAIPAGFTTPLAVENNRAGGIVVTGAPGITIGTLSGTGYFRADWGDNGEGTRVITVKQSAASTFSGTVQAGNTGTRTMSILVTTADGVEEGTDTTLTLSGNNTTAGTTLSIAEGATVKLTGTWSQAINGAGTLIASGQKPTCTGLSADTWTGTVKLDAITSIADMNLANYGNAASKLVLGDLGAENGNLYLPNASIDVLSDVEVAGTVIFRNGYAAAAANFKGALTGAGTLSFPDTSRSFGTIKIYDMDGFTGTINCPARTRGNAAGKIVICSESSTTEDYISGITIADATTYTVNATIAAPVKVVGTIGMGTGSITGAVTLADGATLANAITVTGDVTAAGAINHAYATVAGDTVITCANAEAVAAALTGAPAGLKYVAEDGAVKLAVAAVTVTIPTAPANTKWYYNGEEVSGSISVDPNTDVTLTLKADDGYIFADGSPFQAVTINSGADGATVETPDVEAAVAVAEANGVKYTSFAEAYAAGTEITLLADAETPAFKIEKDVTIDLGGKTLTLAPQGVGSTGTTTLGIQIKTAAANVTIKNGTIAVAESNKTFAVEGQKPIKMLINNYTNLTLTDVTLDGTNLYKEEGTANYVLSNNSGTVALNGATSITAPEGGIAFDVCKYSTYAEPTVTLDTTGTITGDVEVTGGTFTHTAGTIDGEIVTAGNKILNQEGNVYTVIPAVAKVGDTKYASFAEAYAAGTEVTLLANAETSAFKIEKAATIDLGGKTLTLVGPGVGSKGTETLGIQILKSSTGVTIKNGTIAVAASNTTTIFTDPEKPIKMLINNYANLTLENVTLDGTNLVKPDNMAAYTLSNNKGTVTIGGTSEIIAKEGGIAFDVCGTANVTVADTVTISGKIELSGGTLEGGAALT